MWPMVWSWGVVGTVVGFFLGGGVTFMTTSLPWIADIFYITGAGLFLIKFLTWEEVEKQGLDISTYVIVGTILVTALVIWGNHYLNPPRTTPPPLAQSPTKPIPQPPPKKNPSAGSEPKSQPVKHTPPQPPPSPPAPTIVVQLPPMGNLKQRAITLSNEIMRELYRRGWWQRNGKPNEFVVEEMPTTPEGVIEWTNRRSRYFKFRFFDKVLELRNEFAQLHYRDQKLDDFFKYQGVIETANKDFAAMRQSQLTEYPILPQQIEEIAERLKILADQIRTDNPNLKAPQSPPPTTRDPLSPPPSQE